MKFRIKFLFLFLAIIFLLVVSMAVAQNKFNLKMGAAGTLCLNCHDNFKEKLKSPFVHTPVTAGECTECHNPHASQHGKLLGDPPRKICLKCHEQVVPEKAKSIHAMVAEGNCSKCHDPHASKNKNNLLKAGNELCFECHKTMASSIAKVKFKHSPVEKECLNCHSPHASAKAEHLLKKEVVSLCTECHQADRPAFSKQHMNYPVSRANCSSCHNAHGSNRAGILYDQVHMPVANKMCSQCHEAPTSPDPFKTRRPGYEQCRGCHSSMLNETFNKSRVHWSLLDKTGCMNCHEPHASKKKGLLRGETAALCGKCHSDTMEKQERLAGLEKQGKAVPKEKQERGALTHSPVQQGECLACHAPHASNNLFLMKKPTTMELCSSCHEWQKHSTHPIGEKAIDSRNRNVTMDCLSCHLSHGTGYRHMIPFQTVTDLCVQCHKQYKR